VIPHRTMPLLVAGLVAATPPLAAGERTPAATAAVPVSVQPRDGAHDFDSEMGKWTIHIRRLLHPLSGTSDWVTYDGTKVVTPIWGGKANVAEVKADGRAGRLAFIALRLYNPASHQWNLNFASAGAGAFATPLYGEYRKGGIEFIGPDTYEGRSILVRFVSHEEGHDYTSSEQFFSGDGGHTWELNWINEYKRVKG
jgi:hypothetical protein